MRIARYLAHGAEHFGVIDGDNITGHRRQHLRL